MKAVGYNPMDVLGARIEVVLSAMEREEMDIFCVQGTKRGNEEEVGSHTEGEGAEGEEQGLMASSEEDLEAFASVESGEVSMWTQFVALFHKRRLYALRRRQDLIAGLSMPLRRSSE